MALCRYNDDFKGLARTMFLSNVPKNTARWDILVKPHGRGQSDRAVAWMEAAGYEKHLTGGNTAPPSVTADVRHQSLEPRSALDKVSAESESKSSCDTLLDVIAEATQKSSDASNLPLQPKAVSNEGSRTSCDKDAVKDVSEDAGVRGTRSGYKSDNRSSAGSER